MEAYTDFAYVYDVFMDNTPYDKWGGLLVSRLEKEGITDGILLDLGCGTGNMTELLSEKGYDMIGVDYSGEMLNVAMEKRARSGRQILYLQQGARRGCAVVVIREGVAHVKELALCGLSPADAMALVHSAVQAPRYLVSLPAGTLPGLANRPFAMAHPVSQLAEDVCGAQPTAPRYFALAMD